MKKVVYAIVGLLILVIVGAYSLLFTQMGNNILKPTVQKKISKALGKSIEVKEFSLRPSTLKLVCYYGGNRLLDIHGGFSIFSSTMNLNYTVNIKNLGNFVGKNVIKGGLRTVGRIYGSFGDFTVDGTANVFGGSLNYRIRLTDKKPESLRLKASNIELDQLLVALGKPVYAYGRISANGELDDLNTASSKGEVVVNLDKGFTNPEVLKKEFNFENAKIPFNVVSNIKASGKLLHAVLTLNSNVAMFNVTNSDIDLKSKTLKGTFKLILPDLNKLYFMTKRHLRGKLVFNGDFFKGKDLIVNANSQNVAGGKLQINFKNGVVNANYTDGRLVRLLDMLEYPKVFDSKANLTMTYNLKTTKGEAHVKLINGHFLPNRMSFLINTLAGFDITRELYKLSTVDSKIDNMTIVSNLYMKSRLTQITSKDAYVNLRTNKVDAILNVMIAKKPLKVYIKGDLNKPKVRLDLKGYIKGKLNKGLKNIIKVPKSILHLF